MKKRSINWFKLRTSMVGLLLVLCFVVIVARMFQLQVLKKEKLYQMAADQQYGQIPMVPKRGIIYDRKGNELAVSVEVDSIYADCRKVADPDRAAGALAPILKTESGELRRKLKGRQSFEWIERKISSQDASDIKALRLPGIYFLKENQRFYPNGQLGAHAVGFVGLDARGLEGVEAQYDVFLNGKAQVWTTAKDALGRGIMTEQVQRAQEDSHRNITLTLDKHVQHVVETELSTAVEKWGAKGGFAIAMEPGTGKILALASSPSYNPNQFLQSRAKAWRNRAISDVFEPGSMFKAFLAAGAIEENLVRPGDSFYCENGAYKVYDRTIHDHSKHGWLTFQQIIKVSSNIGASKVGEKMGKDSFYRYICSFGFGEKTKVGLPGEAKGILHHPRYWSPVTLNTVSFGQGISVTGIQLVTALSAIANGGSLMKPFIVERITDERGEVVRFFRPEVVRRVVSEETSRKVISLLRVTTEKGGTGEDAVPAGYEIAGKTGTAQKVDPLLRGYSEDRYTSGFMGIAPADDPKLTLLIVIDEPRGAIYGGTVAAPVFKAVCEKVLPYLNALPKGTLVVKSDLGPGSEKPESEGAEVYVDKSKIGNVGNGNGKALMPDLTGLSMRNALSRIEGKGLIIKISGNGRVIEQTPPAGAVVQRGDICFLKFQSPS
jgi:cell division protein FtsI (penicillin-binding protein 3)